MKLTLVIPTYNERDNIALAVKRAHAALSGAGWAFEVIVVDDDSPDGTGAAVEAMQAEFSNLRLIRRRDARGLATAVLRGWQEARGGILAVMDGDLQHPPEMLAALVEALDRDGVDIAVASRHVRGGGVSEWSLIRRGVSWVATLAATWVLPGTLATIRDPMSGFFALRREVIDGCRMEPKGYKILLEVLARGNYHTVAEVPYVFVERKHGGSKLGPRQYVEFVAHLLELGWRTHELHRFMRFSAVGFSGVFVNMGVLAALAQRGTELVPAGAVAVEAAIVWNFLLNEFWSFSDLARRRPGRRARAWRLAKFNLISAGGALINVGLLWALTQFAGMHYLVSDLIGIAAATIWNYGMNANVTWESVRAERRSAA